MKDLILKMESLKDSKEREKIVGTLRDSVKEQNEKLLEGLEESSSFTEWDLLRHDIKFIKWLKEALAKVKDKETREALIEDLDKSITWRENRLLGKTNEYKLDEYEHYEKNYTTEDLYRAENRWIECFDNLPNKVKGILEEQEKSEQAVSEAEIQENLDALSDLELNGL